MALTDLPNDFGMRRRNDSGLKAVGIHCGCSEVEQPIICTIYHTSLPARSQPYALACAILTMASLSQNSVTFSTFDPFSLKYKNQADSERYISPVFS